MALVRAILGGFDRHFSCHRPGNRRNRPFNKPAEMSMADQADMPCCPPPDDGKVSPACAFKCLNFVAALFPATIALSHIVDGPPQSFSDGILYGYISPPTHPPPI